MASGCTTATMTMMTTATATMMTNGKNTAMTQSEAPDSEPVLSRNQIVGDLAEILDISPDELADDTNVFDIGLDSVRLMSLIERWRARGAHRADVVILAGDPTVGAWVRELNAP
jgi:aryl carrier-like protein